MQQLLVGGWRGKARLVPKCTIQPCGDQAALRAIDHDSQNLCPLRGHTQLLGRTAPANIGIVFLNQPALADQGFDSF